MIKFLPTLLFISVLFCACNNSSKELEQTAPVSTPIDSTNERGTAPVGYRGDTIKEELPDAGQGSGHRVNTPDGDSVPSVKGRK